MRSATNVHAPFSHGGESGEGELVLWFDDEAMMRHTFMFPRSKIVIRTQSSNTIID